MPELIRKPIKADDKVFNKLVKKRIIIHDNASDYGYLEDPNEPEFDPWGDLDLGMPND